MLKTFFSDPLILALLALLLLGFTFFLISRRRKKHREYLSFDRELYARTRRGMDYGREQYSDAGPSFEESFQVVDVVDETTADEPLVDIAPAADVPIDDEPMLGGEPENTPKAEPVMDFESAAPPPKKRREAAREEARELIVVLFVRALEGKHFNGPEVLAAMDQLGLEYGDMAVFHHPGLNENSITGSSGRRKPVFSVANMMEPGTFDLDRMESFTTSGLVMFMRLPGSMSGRVAFELMLNNAHQLAELLVGELENEKRQPLTTELIAQLRDKISAFEYGRAD